MRRSKTRRSFEVVDDFFDFLVVGVEAHAFEGHADHDDFGVVDNFFEFFDVHVFVVLAFHSEHRGEDVVCAFAAGFVAHDDFVEREDEVHFFIFLITH